MRARHYVFSLKGTLVFNEQLNMLKAKKTFGKVLKALYALGLLIAFIILSAKPSIKNFMSEKVVTEETEDKTGKLQFPAITLCAKIVGIGF